MVAIVFMPLEHFFSAQTDSRSIAHLKTHYALISSTRLTMDKNCDCILHSLSGLVFGIPVAPDKLIAHLEAYSVEKQRSTTLRLCHRYGKGDGVYINKLSTELIDVIVDFISLDAREELLSRWSNIYHCHRGGCDFSDHITKEELEKLRKEYADAADIPYPMNGEFELHEDDEEYLDEAIEDDVADRQFEVHEDRISTWIARTRQDQHLPCLKGRQDAAKNTKREEFDKYDRVRTAKYITQSLWKR